MSLLPLSGNLLNVPVRQINGGMDPLIEEELATASAARLDELGYDYRYWLLFGRGHEAGGFAYDCVYRDVATAVRDRQPARVRYTIDTRLDVIDPESGLELRFDSAYWVEEIRARDTTALATVDATSLGRPRFETEVERIDVVRDNLTRGADLCGPNPEVRSGDTWRERGIVKHLEAELPLASVLEVSLENVGSLRLDLPRAGIGTQGAWTVRVQTDGPVDVTLAGLRAGQRVNVDGRTAARADEKGAATVSLAQGASAVSG